MVSKLIAAFTALSFFMTSVAWAGPPPALSPAAKPSSEVILLREITLPAELGRIQERYRVSVIPAKAGIQAGSPIKDFGDDPASGVVILIQDAHAIPSAQRKIQKIIEYFQREYGVRRVGVEGASSKLDPQIFKSFPDKERLQKTFEEYFESGELTGPNAAAIFDLSPVSGPPSEFVGVEDWGLYQEGLAFYLAALEREPEVLEQLEVRSSKLEVKKKTIYSKELLEVDRALRGFHKDHKDLVLVLKVLGKYVPSPDPSPRRGEGRVRGTQEPAPTIKALLSELAEEGSETSEIEREVKGLAEKVRKKLGHKSQSHKVTSSRNETSDLVTFDLVTFNQKYQDFLTSRISAGEFGLWMKEHLDKVTKSPGHKSQVSDPLTPTLSPPGRGKGEGVVTGDPVTGDLVTFSSRLTRAIERAKHLRDLQGPEFFKEFESYAQSVKESLFRSEEERKLDRESHRLELLEKLAKLELTREEWNQVKLEVRSWKLEETRLDLHLAFYRNAEKREEAMFENLLKQIASSNFQPPTSNSVLIAGGFHTQGLIQKFKEQGISYVLITPRIDSIPEKINYREQMQGNVSWKEYFRVENGRVNLYEAFVRAVRDKLLQGHKSQSHRGTSNAPSLFPLPVGERVGVRGKKTGDPVTGDFVTLKSWRDQILRDLAAAGRIEQAHEYTRFIDELQKWQGPDQGQVQEGGADLSLTPRRLAPLDLMEKIDRFLAGLRGLESKNALNEQNILKLLQPSTIASTAAGVLSESISPELVGLGIDRVKVVEKLTRVATERSEMRSEGDEWKELKYHFERLRSGDVAAKILAADAILKGLINTKPTIFLTNEQIKELRVLFDQATDPDVSAAIFELLGFSGFQDQEVREFFLQILDDPQVNYRIKYAGIRGLDNSVERGRDSSLKSSLSQLPPHLYPFLFHENPMFVGDVLGFIQLLLGYKVMPTLADEAFITFEQISSTAWIETLEQLMNSHSVDFVRLNAARILQILGRPIKEEYRDHTIDTIQKKLTSDEKEFGEQLDEAELTDLAESMKRVINRPEEQRLSKREMARLYKQIQENGGLPRDILADYFSHGKRMVFIGYSVFFQDAIQRGIVQDIVDLSQRGLMTHFALPLPANQRSSFETFLDVEDVKNTPAVLLESLIDQFGPEEDPDSMNQFLEELTIFKELMNRLRGSVEFYFYAEEPGLTGENALDARRQNLERLLKSSKKNKVLVYDMFYHPFLMTKINLEDTGGDKYRSLFQELMREGDIPERELASVFEFSKEMWRSQAFTSLNNLDEFLDAYPIPTSFALVLGETVLDALRFQEDFNETYAQAWDAVIVRNDPDEGDNPDFFTPPELPKDKSIRPSGSPVPVGPVSARSEARNAPPVQGEPPSAGPDRVSNVTRDDLRRYVRNVLPELEKLGLSEEEVIEGMWSYSDTEYLVPFGFQSGDQVEEQLILIKEALERLIAVKRRHNDFTLRVAGLGTGHQPYEALSITKAVHEVLSDPDQWSYTFLGIDANESHVSAANTLFQWVEQGRSIGKDLRFKSVQMEARSAHLLKLSDLEGARDEVFGEGAGADIILNRHTTYANHRTEGGLFDYELKNVNDSQKTGRVLIVFLSLQHSLKVFGKPSSFYILEPSARLRKGDGEEIPVLVLPGSELVTVRDLAPRDWKLPPLESLGDRGTGILWFPENISKPKLKEPLELYLAVQGSTQSQAAKDELQRYPEKTLKILAGQAGEWRDVVESGVGPAGIGYSIKKGDAVLELEKRIHLATKLRSEARSARGSTFAHHLVRQAHHPERSRRAEHLVSKDFARSGQARDRNLGEGERGKERKLFDPERKIPVIYRRTEMPEDTQAKKAAYFNDFRDVVTNRENITGRHILDRNPAQGNDRDVDFSIRRDNGDRPALTGRIVAQSPRDVPGDHRVDSSRVENQVHGDRRIGTGQLNAGNDDASRLFIERDFQWEKRIMAYSSGIIFPAKVIYTWALRSFRVLMSRSRSLWRLLSWLNTWPSSLFSFVNLKATHSPWNFSFADFKRIFGILSDQNVSPAPFPVKHAKFAGRSEARLNTNEKLRIKNEEGDVLGQGISAPNDPILNSSFLTLHSLSRSEARLRPPDSGEAEGAPADGKAAEARGRSGKRKKVFLWDSEKRAEENIWNAISMNRLDIVERYNRFQHLTANEKSALKKDVYKITGAHFKIWGLGAVLNRRQVPYFNGSYFLALIALFPELDLHPLEFQLDWTTREKAIESIRYILSRETPGLIEQYNQLQNLTPSEREVLKRDIYKINSQHFLAWGLAAALHTRTAPYFEGKSSDALMAVFTDLNLNSLAFRLDWSTSERGLASVRFVLSREAPHHIEKYQRFDQLSPAERELLRQDIYKVSDAHFRIWGLGGALNTRTAPYFDGSYVKVLQTVFPNLHLNPLGFQLDWTTREKAVESIRYVLTREAPTLMERYRRINELTNEETENLRSDIYSIKYAHIGAWGMGNSLIAPYFQRSYVQALLAVFDHPRLALTESGYRTFRKTHFAQRYRWNEGPEQAIENVREAIRQNRPDIINRYENLNQLSAEEIERLKNDIYRINVSHFGIWGLGRALNRNAVPLFNGSHIGALNFTFPEIDLNPLGFHLDWTSQEKSVESIRYVLNREIPTIIERYNRLATLTSKEKEVLGEDIYRITVAHFKIWGLSVAVHYKMVPYFNGSYIKVLRTVFSDLTLNPLGFELDWTSLQRAIESIRFVLSREIPDLLDRYNHLENLSESEVIELKDRIYKINRGHFRILGLAQALSSRDAPYFSGHHSQALTAVFPDMNLNPLGFALDWSTPEKAVESIRYVLSREAPDLIGRYDQLSTFNQEQMEDLKKDIYRLTAGHFQLWGLAGALDKRTSPFFKGSHTNVLLAVFDHPRLGLKRKGFFSSLKSRSEVRRQVWAEKWDAENLFLGAGKTADAFKSDGLEGGAVAKAFLGIQNLNARDLAAWVEIHMNAFSNFFGRYLTLFKSYVQRIGFRIVSDFHKLGSSEIINVNGDDYNLVFFLDKYRRDLLRFVISPVPSAIEGKILFGLQASEIGRLPWRLADGRDNFAFIRAAIRHLSLGVISQTHRLIWQGFHARKVTKPGGAVKTNNHNRYVFNESKLPDSRLRRRENLKVKAGRSKEVPSAVLLPPSTLNSRSEVRAEQGLNLTTFGAAIAKARKLKRLTQEELANVLNVNQGQVSRLEAGRRTPSIAMLVKLANALDQDIKSLLLELLSKQESDRSEVHLRPPDSGEADGAPADGEAAEARAFDGTIEVIDGAKDALSYEERLIVYNLLSEIEEASGGSTRVIKDLDAEDLASDSEVVFIARDKNRGALGFAWASRLTKEEAYLYITAVKEEHHRSGIAMKLLDEAIQFHQSEGRHEFSGFIRKDNIASLRLMDKLISSNLFRLYQLSDELGHAADLSRINPRALEEFAGTLQSMENEGAETGDVDFAFSARSEARHQSVGVQARGEVDQRPLASSAETRLDREGMASLTASSTPVRRTSIEPSFPLTSVMSSQREPTRSETRDSPDSNRSIKVPTSVAVNDLSSLGMPGNLTEIESSVNSPPGKILRSLPARSEARPNTSEELRMKSEESNDLEQGISAPNDPIFNSPFLTLHSLSRSEVRDSDGGKRSEVRTIFFQRDPGEKAFYDKLQEHGITENNFLEKPIIGYLPEAYHEDYGHFPEQPGRRRLKLRDMVDLLRYRKNQGMNKEDFLIALSGPLNRFRQISKMQTSDLDDVFSFASMTSQERLDLELFHDRDLLSFAIEMVFDQAEYYRVDGERYRAIRAAVDAYFDAWDRVRNDAQIRTNALYQRDKIIEMIREDRDKSPEDWRPFLVEDLRLSPAEADDIIKEALSSRSELRQVARGTVDYFLGRPVEAAGLARGIEQSIREASLAEFAEAVREEAKRQVVESESKVVTTQQKKALRTLAWLAEAANTVDQSVAIAFHAPGQKEMLKDALQSISGKSRIVALLSNETENPGVKGLVTESVGKLSRLKPRVFIQGETIQNENYVLAVQVGEIEDLSGNESLLDIRPTNSGEEEFGAFADKVDVVARAVLGAATGKVVKTIDELSNEKKRRDVISELLKNHPELLNELPEVFDLINYRGGNQLYMNPAILELVTDYLARAEVRKAA